LTADLRFLIKFLMLKGRAWVWILMAASIITPFKLAAQTDEAGITQLPPLPGDNLSVAYSVNNLGEAVGYSLGDDGYRAVMWSANGSVTDLDGPGSIAGSINDNGQVLVIPSGGGLPLQFGMVEPLRL
jgi:uncharacterized membrane protein